MSGIGKGSGGIRRDHQSIWCCGKNYRRWRFFGRPFPVSFKSMCAVCGCPLNWPEMRMKKRGKTEQERLDYKTAQDSRNRWRKRNQANSLTCDGGKRKTPNKKLPTKLEQDYLSLRAQMGSTAAEMLTTIGRYG